MASSSSDGMAHEHLQLVERRFRLMLDRATVLEEPIVPPRGQR